MDNKLRWLLILQGWAMLWVVIGHSNIDEVSSINNNGLDTCCYAVQQVLHVFAYSFHMPLFILISGYLLHRTKISREKSYIEVLKSKWIRLFLPYVTFISLAIAVKYVTGSGYRQLDLTPMGFINNYLYPFDGALREMWFVALLFWLILLYPMYKLLISNKVMSVAGGGILIVLYFLDTKNLSHFLEIYRIPQYLIFYYSGILISHYKMECFFSRNIIILLNGVLYLALSISGVNVLNPLFASLFFLGIAKRIENLSPNLFNSFRNYTYQIFLMGIFPQILIKVLYNKYYIPRIGPVVYLACVLAGLYLPVVVSRIVEKSKFKLLKIVCGL